MKKKLKAGDVCVHISGFKVLEVKKQCRNKKDVVCNFLEHKEKLFCFTFSKTELIKIG